MPRIFVENWKKLAILFLQVFTSRTWLSPVSVWKDYSCFSKLLVQKMSKIACFLDECLSLLELLFEAIHSSSFVQKALEKSEFVVKVEKLICQTHEVTTYSLLKCSRLSWMVKRYCIQDYPEYYGGVLTG